MHKVLNFGSALQAFALQRAVEKLGFDVELIDYEYPNTYHASLQRTHGVKAKLVKLAKSIFVKVVRPLMGIPVKKHRERFLSFYEARFKLSGNNYSSKEEIHRNPPKYDIYFTGSDQVWNPGYIGNDTTFMLSFVKGPAPKIAYSASFATDRIDDPLKGTYAGLLKEYEFLSTREKSGGDLLKELTGRDSTVVVDPTLLLTRDEWTKVAETSKIKIDRPYVLVYILGYAFDPYPYVTDLVKHVQKQTGLTAVLLNISNVKMRFMPNTVRIQCVGPEDFVSLFENASLVITDSFHGTAFSLNFERPFYALLDDRPTANNRIANLLELTGASDRGIKKGADYPAEYAMDYGTVSRNLSLLREESADYLKRALSVES